MYTIRVTISCIYYFVFTISFYFMHFINLFGYLAASVQIKPVEPLDVELTMIYVLLLLGMASVDSSAPETTSSDNSPTLVRRNFTGGSGGAVASGHHGGPGSDSGSSQSDSVDSSSSDCKHMTQQAQQLRGALKPQQNDADKYVIRTTL